MTGRYAVEVALHWGAVAFYVGAAVALVFSVVFGKARARRWGLALCAAGLAPHAAALLLRWIAVGHGPYVLKYEVLSSTAWVVLLGFLVTALRRPDWAALGAVIVPLAILAIAVGLFANPESRDLPPTLRSVWLVFHVAFAKVSAAAFAVSLGAAVLLLVAERPAPPAWAARLPGTAALDALVVRSTGFGMIFWTVTIAAGAIWGNQAWGRYWGWDPIETWSLVSWMVYGSFLHARFFFKLGPRTTAWLSIGSFAAFVLVFLVLPLFMTSLHSAYFS